MLGNAISKISKISATPSISFRSLKLVTLNYTNHSAYKLLVHKKLRSFCFTENVTKILRIHIKLLRDVNQDFNQLKSEKLLTPFLNVINL